MWFAVMLTISGTVLFRDGPFVDYSSCLERVERIQANPTFQMLRVFCRNERPSTQGDA
jgi:hypothetical protein